MKPKATSQYSPLIYNYLRKYQEDPTSRVFAPLAEAYRKAGLIEDAIEIAREGLRIHPQFVGGKVALARALFDKEQYDQVIEVLSAVVQDVPDNLIAQRLIADSCLMLGMNTEALSAFKMLLYFSPEDSELAKIVQELESRGYDQGNLVLRTDPASSKETAYTMRSATEAIDSDPYAQRELWMQKLMSLQNLLQRVERYRTRMEFRL